MSNEEPPTLRHLPQTQQFVAGVETSEPCDTLTGQRSLAYSSNTTRAAESETSWKDLDFKEKRLGQSDVAIFCQIIKPIIPIFF